MTKQLDEDDQRAPLAHADLATMYSRIATGLTGKPRKVILREGEGFGTDMKGSIYADPYPLGRRANPAYNLVVTRAGIYHELGHEQFTPADTWNEVLAIAEGLEKVDNLSAAAAKSLPRFFNIVEDGRMERLLARNYAGVAEILAASCRINPRWNERVGEAVPEAEQVFWALLYSGLPYFRVREEVHEGMTPRARAVFDELEPVIRRGVRGTAEEALQAALHLVRRFDEEGYLAALPAQEYSANLPGTPMPKKQKPGDKRRQDNDNTGGGSRSSGGQDDDDTTGGSRSPGGDDDDDNTGGGSRSSGGDDDTGGDSDSEDGQENWEYLDDDSLVDRVASQIETESATTLERGMKERNRADKIGKPLHKKLQSDGYLSQSYRHPVTGERETATVYVPREQTLPERLLQRRDEHKKTALLMAKPLKAIREQAEQRLRRQSEGRLDRRQLVNAYKGQSDIYTRVKDAPETSFTVSLAVDMSQSMEEHIKNSALYDSVMTMGDTFAMLDAPYEVRAFGSSTAHIKSMDENGADPRAWSLAEGDLGGTRMKDTIGLATSALLSRPEKNRLYVCLSDGMASDSHEAAAMLAKARQQGILAFGVYLGDTPKEEDARTLDDLYGGRGNWTSIQRLSDLPQKVAQRIASMFKSIR